MRITTVKDVMTTEALAVQEDAGFKEMVTAMRSQHVTALPVIDSAGRVVGLVTDADLMHKEVSPDLTAGLAASDMLAWHVTGETRASGVSAADMMTWPVVTVTDDATIEEAARLMQARHAKQLPVVDGNGKLRGIVSRLDVLSVFERPDAEIKDEVANGIIALRFGLDPREFAETVRSGIVTVTGPVDRREDALGMLSAIRHLEGVVSVRDGLSYPPEDKCGPQSRAAATGVWYRWHQHPHRHLRRQALAG
jgi:CBS-domain-containing membrane protein